MSRLVIPVIGRTIYGTGDVTLRAMLGLTLKDRAGNFVPWAFQIDSASDVTAFLAFDAWQLNLPLPVNPSPIRHAPTGLEVRSGLLRFRIQGMDATEYVVSCFFLGDPAVVPSPAVAASFPRALLQPLALLDQLKFRMEKDPAAIAASHGEVIIGKR
jgi:hypothetical protein